MSQASFPNDSPHPRTAARHAIHALHDSESDGREYVVPTADHAAINPKGSRVIVFTDDDSQAEVAALHVATVVKDAR